MGKDFDASEGMLTAEERMNVLAYENTLAEQREEKAREAQLAAERQRKTQEEQLRKQQEQTEEERRSALEEQESAAADYAPDETEAAMLDRDLKVTTMWQNLAGGIQETSEENNEQYPE